MGQEAIWDHFQNEGVSSFDVSADRCSFLASKLRLGQRALNIGIGNAGLERRAKAKGVDIWSLDPSAKAIERARDELGDKVQVGYSQNLPFPDQHFDVVVMSEVLEHLEDEVLTASLKEVRRVLKKGGRFIGTTPAREKLEDSFVVCPCCAAHFHRWGHVRSFDRQAMASTLQPYFRPVRVRELFIAGGIAGLVKKALSSAGVGTYGASRSLYFEARV